MLQNALVSIGTLPTNDLVVTDTTVSRTHAAVEEKTDRYVIRDLDSTNGTFLDGVRVREAFLAPGSVIRLGETEIVFSPVEERIEIPKSDAGSFGELTGSSSPMQEIYGILERVSPHRCHRADRGRDRHRQGVGGAGASIATASGRTAPSWCSIAAQLPRT